MGDNGHDTPHEASGSESGRRVKVDEAARELGMSVDGVRKRIERGAIPSVKEGGRRYVLLDEYLTWQDKWQDFAGQDQEALISAKDEQIAGLHDQVDFLRQQLEAEREANRENRRIIAGLVQRIPELEAPPATAEEAEDSASTAAESSGGAEGQGEGAEPERGTQHPWWRRIFGARR